MAQGEKEELPEQEAEKGGLCVRTKERTWNPARGVSGRLLGEAIPKLSLKHVQTQDLRQFQSQTPRVSGASPGQCLEKG